MSDVCYLTREEQAKEGKKLMLELLDENVDKLGNEWWESLEKLRNQIEQIKF